MEFGGNRGHRTSKRVDIIAAQRDSGWLDDARRCALYGIFSASGACFWPRIALYLLKSRRSAQSGGSHGEIRFTKGTLWENKMKFPLSLVVIVGLVGCGDGGSSPDGNASQTTPSQLVDIVKGPTAQPKSDAQSNPETDAQHNSEIDDKPEDKKSNPATSAAAEAVTWELMHSGLWPSDPAVIGAWSKRIGGLAIKYTFREGGEGGIAMTGRPTLRFTWKTHENKLELRKDDRYPEAWSKQPNQGRRPLNATYAVTGDTLTLSNEGFSPSKMVLKRGAPSKHPTELAHTWKSDRLLSNGVRQTMVLGKSGDLTLIQKKHLGKAAKGKWEVDGNRIKLMFVDPVSGDDRQQEFTYVIGGSETESEDGKTTDKRANLYLKGVADNKTSLVYERPLPAATKTDEATAATPEESLTGPEASQGRLSGPESDPSLKPANHPEPNPKQPNTTTDKLIADPLVEKEIRRALKKPEGELTKSDLEKVTKLNFAVAGIEATDQILKEVAKCTQLTYLNFNGGQITAEGLTEVAKLQKLKTLGLSDTGVTDAGLKEVAKCTQLTFLNLLHTKITDAGLKEVAKLKHLNDLTLAYNKITGAGLKELANLTQLRHLWLDGTKVTKADVAELKKALPNCRFNGP